VGKAQIEQSNLTFEPKGGSERQKRATSASIDLFAGCAQKHGVLGRRSPGNPFLRYGLKVQTSRNFGGRLRGNYLRSRGRQ